MNFYKFDKFNRLNLCLYAVGPSLTTFFSYKLTEFYKMKLVAFVASRVPRETWFNQKLMRFRWIRHWSMQHKTSWHFAWENFALRKCNMQWNRGQKLKSEKWWIFEIYILAHFGIQTFLGGISAKKVLSFISPFCPMQKLFADSENE